VEKKPSRQGGFFDWSSKHPACPRQTALGLLAVYLPCKSLRVSKGESLNAKKLQKPAREQGRIIQR